MYFSGSCAMLGPRNKREARLRRRSRPRIAAGPADSRVFASLRRSAAAVFQHTCGVQGDTAAPFAIQQVLFRTGKGGAAMGIVYQEGPSLARDLGLPLRTLYAVSNRIPAHYHRAEVPKRDGGVRVLRVPDPVLKDIQRRIARVLLSGMPVSPHATAYRYGAGVVENARAACGPPRAAEAGHFALFRQYPLYPGEGGGLPGGDLRRAAADSPLHALLRPGCTSPGRAYLAVDRQSGAAPL